MKGQSKTVPRILVAEFSLAIVQTTPNITSSVNIITAMQIFREKQGEVEQDQEIIDYTGIDTIGDEP